MSETYIATAMSAATTAASALTSAAGTLLSAANSSMTQDLVFVDPEPWTYTVRPQETPYSPLGAVDGMPVIPPVIPPKPPEFRNMSVYNGQPLGRPSWPELPVWNPAPFLRPLPENPPDTPTLEPGEFPELALPAPPDTAFPDTPTLLNIAELAASLTIELPNLNLTIAPEPTLPTVDANAEDTMRDAVKGGADGVPGTDALLTTGSEFYTRARALVAPLLEVVENRFASRHAKVFSIKEQRVQELADARLALLAARTETDLTDLTDRSGWTLPAPVQAALRQRVAQQTNALNGVRTDEKALRVMDQARRMMAFCSELYESLRELVESARAAEVESVLAAHDAAVRYAQQKIETLSALFDAENLRKYDLRTAYAEARLKVFESEMAVEQLQYDTVRQQIANEGLQQDQNRGLIEQYEAEADIRATRLGILRGQSDAARAEIEAQVFSSERFRTQIELFAARVRADETNLQKMVADIESNEVELQRLTTLHQRYEMEVRAFEARVEYESERGQKTQDINEAMLNAYSGVVQAAMLPVEHGLLMARQTLATHEINAKIFTQDAELKRKLQGIDRTFLEERQKLRREVLKTFQDLATDATETELKRREAVAQVNARGAQVLANMASGAMSAATAVGGAAYDNEVELVP